MKRFIVFMIAANLLLLQSCSSQDSMKDNVIRSNYGNAIFVNAVSIELLKIVDTSDVKARIIQMRSQIASFNKNITNYKDILTKINLQSNPDLDLKQKCEAKIQDNSNLIQERSQIIAHLEKLQEGGYVISVERSDRVTPEGSNVPEWFIVDRNYKLIASAKDMPFFMH